MVLPFLGERLNVHRHAGVVTTFPLCVASWGKSGACPGSREAHRGKAQVAASPGASALCIYLKVLFAPEQAAVFLLCPSMFATSVDFPELFGWGQTEEGCPPHPPPQSVRNPFLRALEDFYHKHEVFLELKLSGDQRKNSLRVCVCVCLRKCSYFQRGADSFN